MCLNLFNIILVVFLASSKTNLNFADAESKLTPRIVSGHKATQNQFPFMVTIRAELKSTYHSQCGGSLISTQIVLSAAHCFIDADRKNRQVPPSKLRVAAGNIRDFFGGQDSNPNRQERNVINYEIHPNFLNYTKATLKKNFGFDVAVIKLKRPFALNNAVKTIKIAPKSYKPSGQGTVIGYGTVDPYNTRLEYGMKYVSTRILDTNECLRHYRWMHPTNTFCARKFKKGFCAGDSGGPLVVKDGNGDLMVVGLVSYNPGFSSIYNITRDFCALTLDMYASVPAFYDYITDTMKKL